MRSITFVLMFLMLGAVAFVGCAKKQDDQQNQQISAAVTCASGQVFSSQYNSCLQQGNCPSGQAIYNNACVVINGTSTNNCSAGQVFSAQYNQCLNQGNCPSGQGMYLNPQFNQYQCVQGSVSNNNGGSCQGQPGYLLTQMGCLPQGACSAYPGYAQYYNQCIPAISGANTNTGGCVQTRYGCFPQGPCGAGQGYYNGTCTF